MYSPLVLVVLLIVKKALSRNVPYLRHAMMDDDQGHHDWMGTMHPSLSFHVDSSSTSTSGIITSCESPLGPIQEHWGYLFGTMMTKACNNNTDVCCGPLLEFHNCTEPTQAYPGLWSEGVCWGYSTNDCCFAEDGSTNYTFTSCHDSQEKIVGEWDGFHCTHHSLSECCGPKTNISSINCTMSDYMWPCEGSCCAVSQNWTLCPPETERWSQGWTNDVCFGLLEECCHAPQNATNCSDFPYEWPCSGPCCAVEHHFTNCPQNSLPMPGWTDGSCFGMMEHCCYLDTGKTNISSFNCTMSDYMWPCEGSCCAVSQNWTFCPPETERWSQGWTNDVCFGLLEECCHAPQNATNCSDFPYEWPCSGPCCAVKHHFTNCPQNSLPMPGWTDGGCFGMMEHCCYLNTGNELYTFTSCPGSLPKLLDNWVGDTCTAASLSTCCSTPRFFTNCDKSASPWPEKWHDGYCLGMHEDCCYEETGSKLIEFPACFESQEKIPGRWNGSICSAFHLSDCCNGTFSTLDGSEYFLSSNSAASSIGLMFGFVMGFVCISLL